MCTASQLNKIDVCLHKSTLILEESLSETWSHEQHIFYIIYVFISFFYQNLSFSRGRSTVFHNWVYSVEGLYQCYVGWLPDYVDG